MKKYCIYRITNNINGKTYIGQHSYSDKNNIMGDYRGSGLLLKKAYNKYGIDNFTISVIHKNILSKKAADLCEIAYISKERKSGHCEYNISDGGTGGDLGEAVRRKMSVSAHNRKVQPTKYRKYTRTKWLDKVWNRWTYYWMYTIGYTGRHKIEYHLSETKEEHARHSGHKGKTKGYKWYNNGIKNTRARECPEGFVEGILPYKIDPETERLRREKISKAMRKNGEK